MVRILGIASLTLAIVSAVSGHVIRHKRAPPGWNAPILEAYDTYHARYIEFGCAGKHNTTYYERCCHPLLKTESTHILQVRKCYPDDNCHSLSSTSPASIVPPPMAEHTQSRASPSLPVYTTTSTTPSPSPTNTDDGSGSWKFGGFATYFTQGGNAGACGKMHGDYDLIAAIDQALYGDPSKQSPLCGRKIKIVNNLEGDKHHGKSVIVTVADDCSGCKTSNSIDLSLGAFNQIGDQAVGEYPIKWQFV